MTAVADTSALLGSDIVFLERGWLSANNVLLLGDTHATVVDTGYCTHAAQTVELVRTALAGRPLQHIVNTHLHSDHCGGNAALQAAYPQATTWIAPGQAAHVHDWNPDALSYTPTGQACPRFHADGVLQPGSTHQLGCRDWQVHAAPGHDPHSIVLFEPAQRILISADALWENGFGVVFPEIEGVHAFEEVAATLDVIERLNPAIVLPGHGPLLTDVPRALSTARQRLQSFMAAPERHARYAAKVLLKYKLLEWQQLPLPQVHDWWQQTPYIGLLHAQYFAAHTQSAWRDQVIQELVASGAAALTQDGDTTLLCNC